MLADVWEEDPRPIARVPQSMETPTTISQTARK